MIANPQAVASGFLAVMGLFQAAAIAVFALWPGIAAGTASRTRRLADEDTTSLLLLIVAVLGLVRLLAWTNFYGLLKSRVEGLSILGVMCAYGVARLHPVLIATLESTKAVLLLAIGFWFLVDWIDRRSGTSPLGQVRRIVSMTVAVVAWVDCLCELAYLGSDSTGPPITCCTQFLDLRRDPGAGVIPGMPLLGGLPPEFVLSVYFALNILTIGVCRYLSRGVPESGKVGLSWTLVLFSGGALGLVATWWAAWYVIAPRVLRLPYHHCVYELITDTDALGLAAAMALAGNGGLLWPALLHPLRRKAPEAIALAQRRVYAWCGVILTSELLIVGIHLV